MAIVASVTVSMGDETNGSWSLIFLVRFVEMSTSLSPKSMWPGIMIRSSYVYATRSLLFVNICLAENLCFVLDLMLCDLM